VRRHPAPRDDELDRVLDLRRLRIVFQPIIDLTTQRVVGVEALARIPRSSRRSPIPWFERARGAGRVAELDLLAIETALAARDVLPDDVYLAVNLSPTGLLDERIQRLLAVAEGSIVVEITEHEAVEDYPALLECVDALRSRGIRIAIDDAGAGWSTFRHVLELRPEIVKLDQAVITRVDTDPAAKALISALAGFTRDVGATMIAEGVETGAQLEALVDVGVDHVQGFGLGRPGSLAEAMDPAFGIC
jgi:EAL domain-containing protein (putative c-di-GMP-specific phosphodiesterase class I)